jgi:hypothetical protein
MDPILVRVVQGRTYGLVGLGDGRILAFDRRDRRPVYLMAKTAAPDGDYPLALSGNLVVRGGRIAQVREPAQSTTRTLALDVTGNLVARWRVTPPPGRPTTDARGAPIIIDLRGGALMLCSQDSRCFHLRPQPAPDGNYPALPLGTLVVRGGTVSLDPDYDYMLADDYAP